MLVQPDFWRLRCTRNSRMAEFPYNLRFRVQGVFPTNPDYNYELPHTIDEKNTTGYPEYGIASYSGMLDHG